MNEIIPYLIFIHAAFGGVALISGGVALSSKKGGKWHKRSGKLFFISMLISAMLSLIVALSPHHENPFLFSIGIFSSYLLISGYRSLRFKTSVEEIGMDKLISYIVIFTGLAMVLVPVIFQQKINIVLSIFGIIGVAFGIRDLVLFQNLKQLKKSWLKLHLGKMTGGYISAITAFLVVNNVFSGMINWLLPTILGTAFITFWMIKITPKK